MPYTTEVGTAVTIDVIFTVGGVPQLLVTAPVLWKAIAPDRSEFTPTSSTVNTAVIGYQYTLAGADTTTEGAGTYVLWFRTNDADVDGKGTDGYAYYYESVMVRQLVDEIVDGIEAGSLPIAITNPFDRNTARVTIGYGEDRSTGSTNGALALTTTTSINLSTAGGTIYFAVREKQKRATESAVFTLTGTASAALAYTVSLTSATTRLLLPGTYLWSAWHLDASGDRTNLGGGAYVVEDLVQPTV